MTDEGAITSPETTAHRAGFVALVGRPNVGKSTLLNTLLGQKVAIVSHRPQTTRVPVRGILTRPDTQIIFIDTPGIHEPHHELGQMMVKLARRAIPESDVVCMMVDISKPPDKLDRTIAAEVQQAGKPSLLVLNKVDQPPRHGSHLEAYRDLGTWAMEIAISATRGDGLPALLEEIVSHLPESEPLYPEDWTIDQSERFLAAELVREKALKFTNQEVPHAIAVEVDEWEDKENATYIRMTLNVERDSQKGILIGAGGSMLRRIGTAARQDIEEMLERRVYLDLWIKTRPKWRNDPTSLGWLGYNIKDWQ